VLAAPCTIRCAGDEETSPLDADTVVVAADQIRLIAVSYLPEVVEPG